MDMSMTMPSSTMAIASSIVSSSMAMSMPSSTAKPMAMSMGGCKISMTWNWNTIDACFISQTWRITSTSMFAGSCIGVVVLVIVLEGLRRAQREYDSYGRRKRNMTNVAKSDDTTRLVSPADKIQALEIDTCPVSSSSSTTATSAKARRSSRLGRQLVRALLHMVTFGVAYFIMLMAMYYNGYIIICILIGAFLGSFIFTWDQLDAEEAGPTDACETTMCCG